MFSYAQEGFIAATPAPLELAVVIPVLNEAGNIEPLLADIAEALSGIGWEVIFVDDGSTDGTLDCVERIARSDSRVRLIRRIGRRGLSSAVMEGFLATVAPVVAVIDGDRQHDEAALPRLYRAIADGGHELAIGTRYAPEGSTGDWEAARVALSRLSTLIAAPVMKTPLSDPMSGLFALRRDVAIEAAPRLSAVGYKLLLDITASLPRRLKVAEIPYQFRTRAAGRSKLDSAIILEYGELLLDKLIGRFIPAKLVMFGAVGALGLLVHMLVLATAIGPFALSFASGQSLAVCVAMTFNYALNNQFTYRDRRRTGWGWWRGLVGFAAACGLGAIANVGVGTMVFQEQEGWMLAGVAGAITGAVWNYVASQWLVWRQR
ncbi:glycosyltransferase [Pacificimonas sp. ICDLI1SI03]